MYKRFTPAYIVLPDTGLRFMHAQGSVFAQGQPVLFIRQTLFVQGMAGLMDAAPGHGRLEKRLSLMRDETADLRLREI